MLGKRRGDQTSKTSVGGSRKANESRQHRLGGFRTLRASRRSSFVLESDYVNIEKEAAT